MKISYKLKEKEYLDFNLKYIRSSQAVAKLYIFQKLFIGLALGLVLYLLGRDYSLSRPKLIIFFFLALLVWTGLELMVFRLLLNFGLRAKLKKEPELIQEKELVLKEDGIYDRTNRLTERIIWKRIRSLEKLKDYIFIFTSMDYGYIIPRRAFKDQEEEEEFLERILSKLED